MFYDVEVTLFFHFLQDEHLERLQRESDLIHEAYQHYFDFAIVNNDIDKTIATLEVRSVLIGN